MLVFLKNIPASTNHQEIIDFVKPALKKNRLNLFSAAGKLEEVKIIGLKDNDLNTEEYHGLLIITPDTAAKRVIDRLNRNPFKGQRITIREYIVRSIHNDPRTKSLVKQMTLKERRRSSRRRHNLVVIKNSSRRLIKKGTGAPG